MSVENGNSGRLAVLRYSMQLPHQTSWRAMISISRSISARIALLTERCSRCLPMKNRPTALPKARIAARTCVSMLGAQNLAGGGPGQRAALPGDLAVHQRVLDAARAHHHALGAAGQVVEALRAPARADGRRVEDREVGRHSRRDAAAVLDAEEVGR